MWSRNVCFFIFLLLTRSESKSYKNYALLRGVPYDAMELMFYKTLDKVYNVTWWREPTLVHNAVEFSISPRALAQLYRDTEKMTVRFDIIIRNIQSAFDKQKASPYFRRNMQSFNWQSYYRLDDIYEWLKDVSANNPQEVQLHRVGKTHENRTIIGARLTLKESRNRIVYGEKIAVLVLAGGVDLNRNYEIAFGRYGTSKSPSSNSYCGESAFSELESYAMATMSREHRHQLEYYLSVHSYGQFFIIPYMHTSEREDNFDKVKSMADKAAERIKTNHGMTYKTGTSFDTVGYMTSGTSSAWVKKALNISYVLTIELPDTGAHAFALPPGRILPACQATMDGLLEILTPQSDKFMRLGENAAQKSRVYLVVVLLCKVFVYVLGCAVNFL